MTSIREALEGMTDKEKVTCWLEEGHKVDYSVALFDLGVHYNDFDTIIKELVLAEVPILFKKKNIVSNYGGTLVVEEYYLKR